MKNSNEPGSSARTNENKPNSSQLSSNIVMQMEACSLGEIPPNFNEENISQGLERYELGLHVQLMGN